MNEMIDKKPLWMRKKRSSGEKRAHPVKKGRGIGCNLPAPIVASVLILSNGALPIKKPNCLCARQSGYLCKIRDFPSLSLDRFGLFLYVKRIFMFCSLSSKKDMLITFPESVTEF
jgi:hypothetical protein